MTEIDSRHAEMSENPPTLVELLLLHEDEEIELHDFAPVNSGGKLPVNYTLGVRKIEFIEGIHDNKALVKDLTVSDREIEEAKIWAVGRDNPDLRRFGIESQIRRIDYYVTDSVIEFLSVGRVDVDEISLADPDYKVESIGVIHTPDLIKIIRLSEDADGGKMQDSLIITGDKFLDAFWQVRDRRFDVRRKIGDIDTLEGNIALVKSEFDGYVSDKDAPIA